MAVALALAHGGLSPENVTRLLVLAFLGLQWLLRRPVVRAAARLPPRARFVALATLLAAVVEGLHMGSKPVFDSLRVGADASAAQALAAYAEDLAFTLPAYLVIFSVLYGFVRRFQYGTWAYVLAAGLGQTLGDGGIFFFAGAPHLLLLLPYPVTNYHAMNVLPFLAVRDELPAGRREGWATLLVVPALVATYLFCGALIKLAGRSLGFE